jgi:hypothetical protein
MKLLPILTSICFVAFAHTASAQATRTWVSGVGDDANPGSRTAPCKTFAGAISKTAASGVISVLDPGGFGTVTITKSITIDGGGVEGSILGSLVNGVIINAAATDVVVLRNLQLEGTGTGLSGIKILNAGAVYVENCRIKGFKTGIEEVTTATTGTQIFLRDSFIHECNIAGISLTPGATAASAAVVSRSRVEACAIGIVVNPRAKAILDEATVAFNDADGLKKVGTGLIQSFKNNKVFGNNPDGPAPTALKVK